MYNHLKYLIDCLNQYDFPLQTIKVNIMLFYAQSYNLALNDQILFETDFIAGIFCPKINIIYPGRFNKLNKDQIFNNIKIIEISQNDKNLIDYIVKGFVDISECQLTDIVRSESPWKIAREGVESGADCNNIIQKENMKIYYRSEIENDDKYIRNEGFDGKSWFDGLQKLKT